MLILFGFSMLPKRTVHDLLASHKDSCPKTALTPDAKNNWVGWAGFHCHCEHMVVESPFLQSNPSPEFHLVPGYIAPWLQGEVSISIGLWEDSHLRGPPSFESFDNHLLKKWLTA